MTTTRCRLSSDLWHCASVSDILCPDSQYICWKYDGGLPTVRTSSFDHLSNQCPSLAKSFYSYPKAFVLLPAPYASFESVFNLSPSPATIFISTTRKMLRDIYPTDRLLPYKAMSIIPRLRLGVKERYVPDCKTTSRNAASSSAVHLFATVRRPAPPSPDWWFMVLTLPKFYNLSLEVLWLTSVYRVIWTLRSGKVISQTLPKRIDRNPM